MLFSERAGHTEGSFLAKLSYLLKIYQGYFYNFELLQGPKGPQKIHFPTKNNNTNTNNNNWDHFSQLQKAKPRFCLRQKCLPKKTRVGSLSYNLQTVYCLSHFTHIKRRNSIGQESKMSTLCILPPHISQFSPRVLHSALPPPSLFLFLFLIFFFISFALLALFLSLSTSSSSANRSTVEEDFEEREEEDSSSSSSPVLSLALE